MNVRKNNESKDERHKDNLPLAIFVCPKTNIDNIQDYKQIFTDIISDRIKQKYK